MGKYRITNAADADISHIWRHIARDRPAAADRMIDRIHERIKLLADNQELGELRRDLAVDIRHSIVSPYVILYRLREETLEIVCVIHAAQDVPVEFRKRFPRATE